MASIREESAEPLRFVDILTTATSIATARNGVQIGVDEVVLAVQVVTGAIEIEEVGGAVHPLLMRGSASRPVVPAVRELIQRWYASIGGTAASILTPDDARRFVLELEALRPLDGGDGSSLE